MAFDVDQFIADNNLAPSSPSSSLSNQEETVTPTSSFDINSFLQTVDSNSHLPNPAIPEEGYGEAISKEATNAKLGLMEAVGGGMQSIGNAPIQAAQQLMEPQPSFPSDAKKWQDYVPYFSYPINQGLAKLQLAASALPAAIVPDAMTNMANSGQSIQQEALAQQQENQPNIEPGSFKSKLTNAVGMGMQITPALLAGAIAPESIPGLFGIQGAASTNADQLNSGKTGLLPSVISGGANVVAGEIPMGIITQEGGSVAAKVLKGAIAGEVTADGLNAIQQGINAGTIDPNMTWDQFKQGMKDNAGVGAIVGATGGTIAHLINGSSTKTAKVKEGENQDIFNPTTGEMEEVGGVSHQATPLGTETLPTEVTGAPEAQSPVAEQSAATTPQDVAAAMNSKSDNVSVDTIKAMKDSGQVQFVGAPIDGKWIATPVDAQAIADHINAGGSVPQGTINDMIQRGNLQFNKDSGKLEAAPITSEQQAAREKIASSISDNLAQQQAVPLLSSPAMEGQNIAAIKSLRDQSLENIVDQIKMAAIPTNNIDDTKPITNAQQDFSRVVNDYYINNNMVENLKNKIPENEQPITLGATSDTDTFKKVMDAIQNKEASGLDTKTLSDMIDNGIAKINGDGYPELTPDGIRLHQAIKDEVLPEGVSTSEKQKLLPDPEKEQNPNSQFFEEGQRVPDTVPQEKLPSKGSESKPITRPSESNLPEILDDSKDRIDQHLAAGEDVNDIIGDARKRLDIISQKRDEESPINPNDILHNLRLTKIGDRFDNPSKGLPELANYLAVSRGYKEAHPDVFAGKEYSVTPTDKFTKQGPVLKQRLNDIIRRINPDVKTEFTDKLFGDGEALKESGAPSTAKQEVAGSYDRINNLIKVSTDESKWNPTDTAFHEAIHSVEDMMTSPDKSVLKEAFPGTDQLSQKEHQTVGIAKILTDKNATGIIPAVRRIVSKIAQALRDIGRAFKLGKFNSVNDIANRIESGKVYSDYQKAIRAGDIDALKQSNLSPLGKKQAIKDISPALHDIVYKAMSDKDEEALKDINMENNGTPLEKATALGADIYNNAANKLEEAKEKMLRTTVSIAKPIMTEKAFNRAKDRVENSIAMTKRNSDNTNVIKTLNDVRHVVISSIDGFGRALSDRYNSPTIRRIMDIFHADPGKGRSIGATYHEDIANFYNKTMSQVANVLEGVKSQTNKDQIRDFMVNPSKMTIDTTKEGNGYIASKLARQIQEMRKQLAAAGYEVPEVEGFYPRIYDTDFILKNEGKFRQDAAMAYEDTYKEDLAGLSPEDRESTVNNMVDKWFNNILLQDNGTVPDADRYFRNISTKPDAPSSFKSRTLSKAADDILASYMVKDPLTAMNKLSLQTARKAAWEKNFGGTKLQDMHNAMIKEGVDGHGIEQVMNIIRSNTGQLGGNVNSAIRNGLALSRYWTAVSYLAKAPFKHLSIALNVGNQTGNVANTFRALNDSIHALLNTDKGKAMKTLGELSGVYGEAAQHSLLMNQMGMATDNAKINWLTQKYFDAIGMTQLVGSNRVGMIRPIQYYLADMAHDVSNNTSTRKSSEFMLRDYGIPQEEMNNFSQWVKDGGGKKIQQSLMLDNSKYSKMYQTALQRAVNQMISNPTAATRQMYANHPVGSIIYQLSAYHMAFMKNSMERNARMFGKAVSTDSNLSMRDRVRFATPLLMTVPVMAAFSTGYNAARNALSPPDRKSTDTPEVAGTLDVGMFGLYDSVLKDIAGSKMMQKEFGYKYHAFDGSALGPDVNLAQNYWKMLKNIPNNWSQSSKARSAQLKAEYTMLVAPIATAAISTYNPFPIPGFLAIQAVNSTEARRTFVDNLK